MKLKITNLSKEKRLVLQLWDHGGQLGDFYINPEDEQYISMTECRSITIEEINAKTNNTTG